MPCFRTNYGGPLVYSALVRSALERKASDVERNSSELTRRVSALERSSELGQRAPYGAEGF